MVPRPQEGLLDNMVSPATWSGESPDSADVCISMYIYVYLRIYIYIYNVCVYVYIICILCVYVCILYVQYIICILYVYYVSFMVGPFVSYSFHSEFSSFPI